MKTPDSKLSKVCLLVISLLLAFLLGTKAQNFRLSSFSASSQNGKLPSQLDLDSVQEVYSVLKENFDGKLNEQQLLDGVKKGLISASGDPYTNFLSKSEAQLFNSQIDGSFEGIGAQLGQEGGRPIVIAPIDGYPAQKAGVQPKDIIVEIDDKDTAAMTLDEAVLKIRGKAGTEVNLKIQRGSDSKLITIKRETIAIPSVKSEIIENGSVGYLRLTQFGDDTNELADKAAKEFKDKGVKAVILDLRNNPGGLLDSATHIAGLWVDDRVVVREKRDGKVIDNLKSTGYPILKGLPTVILADEGSASASEIVTGALQDYKLATFVGKKTYGKGSVQEITRLDDGSEVKITIARWYTPKDKNIDRQGIKPDVEVALGTDASQDPQKAKAIEILRSKIGN